MHWFLNSLLTSVFSGIEALIEQARDRSTHRKALIEKALVQKHSKRGQAPSSLVNDLKNSLILYFSYINFSFILVKEKLIGELNETHRLYST